MDIKLYHTSQSRSVRPRWLMEEMGLDYQLINIDLFGGEGESEQYKKIHPLGQVPALEVNGEIMLESGAMCHWLADHFIDHELAPTIEKPERRHYEQWMSFAQTSLEPWPWLAMLHAKYLPEEQRVAQIIPWAYARLQPSLVVLNDALLGKDYLLGKQFTSADVMVGSVLLWVQDRLTQYPELLVYTERLKARPAYVCAAA